MTKPDFEGAREALKMFNQIEWPASAAELRRRAGTGDET